jgi:tetratricopeptide (TPR) repeat protein
MSAELGHELGEASTLLALIAYAQGTWHDLFRKEFADSVRRGADLEMAVFDAHLCFQEFYLYGPEGHVGAAAFAQELLDIATKAESTGGQALATLLLGEVDLLSGDVQGASNSLKGAALFAKNAGCVSAESIALERLAEALVASGNNEQARDLLELARPLAESSGIPSHLIVRLLGVQVCAAGGTLDALHVAGEAERFLADAPRICEPCSMNLRIEATRVFARTGDLARARRHLAKAERIAALWQGGPWNASVWEARAELRLAEGEIAQAIALFLEAASGFAQLRRPIDEARCRASAQI